MFYLLLSGAYPESQPFQLPALCQQRGAQDAGRELSQDRQPKLAKGTFHNIRHYVQYRNRSVLAGRTDSCLGTDWSLVSRRW